MRKGINSFIKNYVELRHSLVEFFHHFVRAIVHYQNNELNVDFASLYGEPMMTSALDSIEHSSAKVFTREIFRHFKQQLE